MCSCPRAQAASCTFPRRRRVTSRLDDGSGRPLNALNTPLCHSRRRTDRQSVRPESVTYVSGMNCHPCVRNGPEIVGSSGWIRTSNPPVNRLMQVVGLAGAFRAGSSDTTLHIPGVRDRIVHELITTGPPQRYGRDQPGRGRCRCSIQALVSSSVKGRRRDRCAALRTRFSSSK
jgi:hypothetical protein